QGLNVAPLVELLRNKYDPLRHNWGNRYLHRTLPAADAQRLEKLIYVGTPKQISAKRVAAAEWFEDLATELERRTRLVPAT
ncbi:MAG: hypothetical protein JWM35_1098, partial [Verrucomicrobia bacterium]|nr:hypothetical protein [Verrucomicrobiota bacterium]